LGISSPQASIIADSVLLRCDVISLPPIFLPGLP
jgi:hypothetical protein